MGEELTHKLIVMENKYHLSSLERGINLDTFNSDMNIAEDWRTEFKEYLKNPNKRVSQRVKAQIQNFVLLEGELYRK